MITFGEVYGGPERGTKVEQAIRRLTRLAEQIPVSDSGLLNIVFHVPGSITGPDYQGVRSGTLFRRLKKLQVQIAVPPGLEQSEPTHIERVLLRLLREAVRVAQPVFERARIPYRLDAYEEIVNRVERGIAPH
jgi:hypothetical protein